MYIGDTRMANVNNLQKSGNQYIGEQPWGMPEDMSINDVLEGDADLWVPISEDVWSRPLHLNTSLGYYVHVLRVNRSGILQRHRHSGPVHAWVIRGSWYYPEHDWVAKEGGYVFEPPGETHTLTVPDDCPEMITLFTVFGSLTYVDTEGNPTGYDDVFTRIELYRKHFAETGRGPDYVKRFIR